MILQVKKNMSRRWKLGLSPQQVADGTGLSISEVESLLEYK
jgi:hypothetical protein